MTYFYQKFSIVLVTVMTIVAISLSPAYAGESDLVVNFETIPLFDEANFLPGNTVTRFAEVANNTGEVRVVVVEAINVSDPDDFGATLDLVIKEEGTELYNDSLGNFFNAGEVTLSSLAGSGESTTYDFSVTFLTGSGDSYQENNLGFDILIGFQGYEGVSESGGGGGGGGSPQGMTIIDETVEVISIGTTDATITWSTNYRSTSRVVYGTTPGAFDFSNLPNYGYVFSTAESDTPALSNGTFEHSITISGLSSGATYYFRAISHASPPTISFEHVFNTLSGGAVDEDSDSGQTGVDIGNQDSGSILGASTTGPRSYDFTTEQEQLAVADSTSSLSSFSEHASGETADDLAGLGFPPFLWLIFIAVFLLLVIWYILGKKRKNKREDINQS